MDGEGEGNDRRGRESGCGAGEPKRGGEGVLGATKGVLWVLLASSPRRKRTLSAQANKSAWVRRAQPTRARGRPQTQP